MALQEVLYKCDCCVNIDIDLQDDIHVIDDMILGAVTMMLLLMGSPVQGWTSLMLVMSFFFSLILLIFAMIGEYLAKFYFESTNRPRFFVDRTTFE